MKCVKKLLRILFISSFLLALAVSSKAQVTVQCRGDADGDSVPDPIVNGVPNPDFDPDVRCMHLAAGDGFINMADGYLQYIFGFSNVTGTAPDMVMNEAMLAAEFTAPTIAVDEGNEFYLTLTNAGFAMRPDLFDPHSIHWHGFPQAAPVFDGVPDSSVTPNMTASLTYYYYVSDPGTYMYHCHVEATEHMQMGMLGNLYVRPNQNTLPDGAVLNGGFVHHTGYKYAYNDGDGSTYYDSEYPIQMGSFDPDFHDASMNIQPLPFADMKDKYPMLNGRGYPDTINPDPLTPPAENGGIASQKLSSLITASAGQKVLLRISNLNVTRDYTLAVLGIPMMEVGKDARLLRSSTGENLYRTVSSVTLGSGESADVILDTSAVSPGTYFLYTTNLNYLSNNTEDFGGMMTEIVIQ